MKLIIFICFILSCLNVVESGIGDTHATKAEGILYCGSNPLSNAVVRLLRANTESIFLIIILIIINKN